METFCEKIGKTCSGKLTAQDIRVIQVNVGLKCNQSCTHCHLDASPQRTEMMSEETMNHILRTAAECDRPLIDITGGAPEMNAMLKSFIKNSRALACPVQVRTNLSILTKPDYSDFAEFYAQNDVSLVGSLPCYLEENVDAQRGTGAYSSSIKAIKQLNRLGYGPGGRTLDLVYNPAGPSLPPDQANLEKDYRKQLKERFGIEFSHLLTITNVPIGRFLRKLEHENGLDSYRRLLFDSFNPQTVESLMCRHQISVGWDGRMYDCDFNLALGMPVNHGAPGLISDFDFDKTVHRQIVTAEHCYACTAGAGSSCGGALA